MLPQSCFRIQIISVSSNLLDLKEGTMYLKQEELEPIHGVNVQGDDGASSPSCGLQQELQEVVMEVTSHIIL
jgi:hypothetical protein